MNLFSISELARYSGVKAHTIRMWEQRYDALKPHRSEGNTRYYDSSQLRRLLNIVSLKGQDYKVADLCVMRDEDLFELVNKTAGDRGPASEEHDFLISQMIAAGLAYNESGFDKLLSHCLIRFGVKRSYTQILYPMLYRIGMMWAGNLVQPAYEHFISNLVRKKLITAIDALPAPKNIEDTWLLFLPEDEYHEFGLLLSYYLIQHSGRRVIYLGASVPLSSLSMVVKETSPARLLSFVVHRDDPAMLEDYLNEINKITSWKKIYVTGNKALYDQVPSISKINWLHSISDLEAALNQ